MSDYVRLAVDGGAKIIGGCCGTSFEHLKAMRQALDSHQKEAAPDLAKIVDKIGPLRNKAADNSNTAPRRTRRSRMSGT